VHYDTQTGDYSNKTISRELLNVLWLIAAFILLIACVNFVNLSTAQAVNRAKEVSVRKVLGTNKSQLQIQFIIETFLIVISAVTLAIVITILALPYINQLLELSLSFNILNNPAIILFLLTVAIAVTALACFCLLWTKDTLVGDIFITWNIPTDENKPVAYKKLNRL